jgi:putative sterol carrier protein
MHLRPFLSAAAAAALFLSGSQAFAGVEAARSPQSATEADANDKTPDQVFEGMRKSFQPEKAKGVHIRYQFRFKAPQAGDWWIIVNDGAFTMGKGAIERADVTFACTGSDWVELSNGTLGGIRAYLTGRLHVTGSQSLARKLDEMFP